MAGMNVFIYGPPASGKSSVGKALAEHSGLAFVDLDEVIEFHAQQTIADIFRTEGERGFRMREKEALQRVCSSGNQVVALGGGALLDEENRKMVEGVGEIYCLHASMETLMERLSHDHNQRPLLAEEVTQQLAELLHRRADHYQSFRNQVVADSRDVGEVAWEIQLRSGVFRVAGMGRPYIVRVQNHSLGEIGEVLRQENIRGRCFLLSDDNVAQYYLFPVHTSLERAGYKVVPYILPPGENTKNIDTIQQIWVEMTKTEIDRSSFLLALGGGVVSDIGGFAAATYMRGIPWVVVPTTLLSMADASLGGKTGIDLPAGKNLVGAFHPPQLVWADPVTLETLPTEELRSGLAEVVKSGIIGDALLYDLCAKGMENVRGHLRECVCRSMAVKIKIIQADPFERGRRAVLNLGHTVGHAIEVLSNYSILHGFAVSMGMVAEAKLSVMMQLAAPNFPEQIAATLTGLGLPVKIPENISPQDILQAMRADKKKRDEALRFALPIQIGNVEASIAVRDQELILQAIDGCRGE